MTEHIEQEAENRREQLFARVQQNATLKFQAQAQEAYFLEAELARLQRELLKHSADSTVGNLHGSIISLPEKLR